MQTDLLNQQKKLAAREHALHDHLAEITQRLSNARATLQIYENELQRTLAELTHVHHELEDLSKKLEASWHRPIYRNGGAEQDTIG